MGDLGNQGGLNHMIWDHMSVAVTYLIVIEPGIT
jgi:hypothetical protein